MKPKIKLTKISKTKSKITGYFKLTDGSRTGFVIHKSGEWEQWGNSTDNLCVSVPRVERMTNEFVYEEN